MPTPKKTTAVAPAKRLDSNGGMAPFLLRQGVSFTNQFVLSAEQWRMVVAKAPIVAACIRTLVTQVTALEWSLSGKDDVEVAYYTKLLHNANGENWSSFIERVVQDVLEVPFGGAIEPTVQDGKLVSIYHVDGGTLSPTYDEEFPYIQVDPDNSLRRVFFTGDELKRIAWSARSDLRNYGWSKTPVMEAFRAIEALMRIDVFYASLLSDTPEAGILDLMDMKQEEVEQWVKSWQAMYAGIDPFKIPVLYEHTMPANFIKFNRSPEELRIEEIMKRYAELVCSLFGMNIGDLGLFEHSNTMAGTSKSVDLSKRQGLGMLLHKIKTLLGDVILPESIEFRWDSLDDEDRLRKIQSQRQRAETLKILAAPANPTAGGPGIFPLDVIREQAINDGLIDVIEVADLPRLAAEDAKAKAEADKQAADIASANQPPASGKPGTAPAITGNTTPTSGDAKTRAFDDDLDMVMRGSAVVPQEYAENEPFAAEYEDVIEQAFDKARGKIHLDQVKEAVAKLPVNRATFDPSEEQVLNDWLETIGWSHLSFDEQAQLGALKLAFESGLRAGALDIQRALYKLKKAKTPSVGMSFNLENPLAIRALEARRLANVRQLEEGTRYYMLQAFRQAFSNKTLVNGSPEELVRNIFAGLTDDEQGAFGKRRIRSIVRTELNYAHSAARLQQYQESGLKHKKWEAVDILACSICAMNEQMGPVDIDFDGFGSVFGDVSHPPAHPHVCHCRLSLVTSDLLDFEDAPEYWDGSDDGTRSLKTLSNWVEEQRHLPGKHDQREHTPNHGPVAAQPGAQDTLATREPSKPVLPAALAPVAKPAELEMTGVNSANTLMHNSARSGEDFAGHAKDHGMTTEEYTARVQAKIRKEYMEGGSPAINMTDESLAGVLKAGRFKAANEKRPTWLEAHRRENYMNQRNAAESVMFTDHPVYGYMHRPDMERDAKDYGRIRVVLKDNVLDHSSVTIGDSLAHFNELAPTPARNVGVASVMASKRFDHLDDRITNANDKGLIAAGGYPYKQSYAELQIHGTLKVDSIKEVVIGAPPPPLVKSFKKEHDYKNGGFKYTPVMYPAKPHEPSAELVAALQKAGIPWRLE